MSTGSPASPTVLFDGVCPLCHGAVRWIARHDPGHRLRFAPLESGVGRALLAEEDATPARGEPETVVLVDESGTWERSDAVLRILAQLRAPWRWLAPLRFVPRSLRDGLYDFVARRRRRWFGRLPSCPLPPPELRDRFLAGPVPREVEGAGCDPGRFRAPE